MVRQIRIRRFLALCLFILDVSDSAMRNVPSGSGNLRRSLQDLTPAFFGENLSNDGEKLTSFQNADTAREKLFRFFRNPETETFESFPLDTQFPFISREFSSVGDAFLSGADSARVTSVEQFGRYGVSGEKFLDVDANDDFVMQFQNPIVGFGFYAIDVGDNAGTLTIETTLNGGSFKRYVVQHTRGRGSGPFGSDNAVMYAGIIDLDGFDTITFNLQQGDSPLTDFFGFDDFSVFSIDQFVGTELPTVSLAPSTAPSLQPTTSSQPTNEPSTPSPTVDQSEFPTQSPTTTSPTRISSTSPSAVASEIPSATVSSSPTFIASASPSLSLIPSTSSSAAPSLTSSSALPSLTSSSAAPSLATSTNPSIAASTRPSTVRSSTPSTVVTSIPTVALSSSPTPSLQQSSISVSPTPIESSSGPADSPVITGFPTAFPTSAIVAFPTASPSVQGTTLGSKSNAPFVTTMPTLECHSLSPSSFGDSSSTRGKGKSAHSRSESKNENNGKGSSVSDGESSDSEISGEKGVSEKYSGCKKSSGKGGSSYKSSGKARPERTSSASPEAYVGKGKGGGEQQPSHSPSPMIPHSTGKGKGKSGHARLGDSPPGELDSLHNDNANIFIRTRNRNFNSKVSR